MIETKEIKKIVVSLDNESLVRCFITNEETDIIIKEREIEFNINFKNRETFEYFLSMIKRERNSNATLKRIGDGSIVRLEHGHFGSKKMESE